MVSGSLLTCTETQRVVEHSISAGDPDHGNLILGKVPEESPHGTVQGNILPGVVQDPENLDELTDLLRRKITRSGLCICRDSFTR